MVMKKAPSIECIISVLEALSSNEITSLDDVQKATKYSRSSLEIAASFLSCCNLVSSFRGPGGGYKLIKSTDEIKLKDMISALPPSHKTLSKAFSILSDMSISEFLNHK